MRAISVCRHRLGESSRAISDALKRLLSSYGLALVGGWYSGNLLLRTASEEIGAMQPHLAAQSHGQRRVHRGRDEQRRSMAGAPAPHLDAAIVGPMSGRRSADG